MCVDDRCQHRLLCTYLRGQGLSLNQELMDRLDCLCPSSVPRAPVADMCSHSWRFTWVPGDGLHSRHAGDRAISLPYRYFLCPKTKPQSRSKTLTTGTWMQGPAEAAFGTSYLGPVSSYLLRTTTVCNISTDMSSLRSGWKPAFSNTPLQTHYVARCSLAPF